MDNWLTSQADCMGVCVCSSHIQMYDKIIYTHKHTYMVFNGVPLCLWGILVCSIVSWCSFTVLSLSLSLSPLLFALSHERVILKHLSFYQCHQLFDIYID